jgi:hypothetical protein
MEALSLAIQNIWPALKFLQRDRPKPIYPDLSIHWGIKMTKFNYM